MNDYGVLNSRKRAVIALIHSLAFLGVAMHGFVSPKLGIVHGLAGSHPATPAQGGAASGDFALIGIYFIVASILAWLVTISRCARERIYFALCACSAAFGLLRTLLGDSSLSLAQYMRAILLTCAVAVGAFIVRSFSSPALETSE